MENFEILKNNGFQGFKTMAELRDNTSLIPTKQGVYVVLYDRQAEPAFLEIGTGGFFKGKNPNVTIEKLEQKWVDDTPILYIGKAGGTGVKATLNSRIIQYLKFGQGNNVGHWGGRYIWQLQDAEDLRICWKETSEEPRAVEKQMIADFKNEHNGKRPFANVKG